MRRTAAAVITAAATAAITAAATAACAATAAAAVATAAAAVATAAAAVATAAAAVATAAAAVAIAAAAVAAAAAAVAAVAAAVAIATRFHHSMLACVLAHAFSLIRLVFFAITHQGACDGAARRLQELRFRRQQHPHGQRRAGKPVFAAAAVLLAIATRQSANAHHAITHHA
jgi:hypothetical protein